MSDNEAEVAPKEPSACIGNIPTPPPEGWKRKLAPGTMWAEFELAYLRVNLPLYRERKKDDREKLLNWVKRRIRHLWGNKYNDDARRDKNVDKEWRRRKKSISDWFRNHSRTKKEGKIPFWTGNITYDKVLDEMYKDRIHDICDDLAPANARRGSKIWFAHRQKAKKRVSDALTAAERAEIRAEVVRRQGEAVPEDAQAREAEENGRKRIRRMHQLLHETMGIRCITFTMHYRESGDPVSSHIDINNNLVKAGCAKVPTFRGWSRSAFETAETTWADYCEHVVGIEKPEFRGEEVNKARRVPPVAPTIEQPDGDHVRIPDAPTEREFTAVQRTIYRQFVNKEYDFACGNPNPKRPRSAPWGKLLEQPDAFIDDKYLPATTRLEDPEKINKDLLSELLSHWRTRQNNGEVALKFKRILSGNSRVAPRYPNKVAIARKRTVPRSSAAGDDVRDAPDNAFAEDEDSDNTPASTTTSLSDDPPQNRKATPRQLVTPANSSPAAPSMRADTPPAPAAKPKRAARGKAKRRRRKVISSDSDVSDAPSDSAAHADGAAAVLVTNPSPSATPTPAPKLRPKPRPRPATMETVLELAETGRYDLDELLANNPNTVVEGSSATPEGPTGVAGGARTRRATGKVLEGYASMTPYEQRKSPIKGIVDRSVPPAA